MQWAKPSHRSLTLVSVSIAALLLALQWTDTASAETDDLQTVAATGLGVSRDAALKSAFENAVQQVVGLVVDADSLIANDEVIHDQVLTYSNAYIQRYDELGAVQREGLYEIRIRATVKRKDLVERIRTLEVTSRPVEGKALFAEAVSQIEAEADASEIVRSKMRDFPSGFIRARVATAPEILSKSATGASVRVVVSMDFDPDAYTSFSKELSGALEAVATEHMTVSTTGGKSWSGYGDWAMTDCDPYLFLPKSVGWADIRVKRYEPDLIGVVESVSGDGQYLHWRIFRVERAIGRSFRAAMESKKVLLEVSLVDASGGPIWSERNVVYAPALNGQRLETDVYGGFMGEGFRDPEMPTGYFIAPVSYVGANYRVAWLYEFKVDLTLDDLRRISAAKAAIQVERMP